MNLGTLWLKWHTAGGSQWHCAATLSWRQSYAAGGSQFHLKNKIWTLAAEARTGNARINTGSDRLQMPLAATHRFLPSSVPCLRICSRADLSSHNRPAGINRGVSVLQFGSRANTLRNRGSDSFNFFMLARATAWK